MRLGALHRLQSPNQTLQAIDTANAPGTTPVHRYCPEKDMLSEVLEVLKIIMNTDECDDQVM